MATSPSEFEFNQWGQLVKYVNAFYDHSEVDRLRQVARQFKSKAVTFDQSSSLFDRLIAVRHRKQLAMAEYARHTLELEEQKMRDFMEAERQHLQAQAEVLAELGEHWQPTIFLDENECKIALADDSNTELETLWQLVEDPSEDVRYALAENHNVAEVILEALAVDENPFVAWRAQKTLRRISTPAVLHGRFQQTSWPHQRFGMA
jgi:hypothetical protein